MNNIIEPNDSFDFTKLSLAHPNGIQGGAYFTKLLYNSSPLYIQTTKSLTRQGFIKSGKKYYCDLMFDNNSEILIRWFENLEETCQKLIFDKSESWFQNSLDKSDVESAFNSAIRIYKSGKYYLLRTNVKINANNEPAIKIYNENEFPLSINDINSETNLISILEIQGIKFTSRNFQIEIELKQTMVLDNEPLFTNCLIKTIKRNGNIEHDNSSLNKTNHNDNIIDIVLNDNLENNSSNGKQYTINEDNKYENTCENNNLGNNHNLICDNHVDIYTCDQNNKQADNNDDKCNIDIDDNSDDNHNVNHEDNINTNNEDDVDIQIEDLNEKKLDDYETNKDILKEIELDVNLENNLETFTLKKPNQVYYELYKEARNKAKIAKKAALIAYLEAKNIKKTYLLDKIDNSDGESDIDDEIDEVSESELESL